MNMGKENTEVYIPLSGGGHLHGTFLRPKKAERVVMISPLAGSDSKEQLLTFRIMTRKNCELFSFEYQGHGESTGAFSLANTLEDTKAALDWIIGYGQERNLPVHTHSTCYGLITLLKCFEHLPQDHPRYSSVRSVNSVSGLPDLYRVLGVEDFLAKFNMLGAPVLQEAFFRQVESGEVNFKGKRLRTALKHYLKEKLPDLIVKESSFGKLDYQRVDMKSTFTEFHQGISLEEVILPQSIPAHFFYGIHDAILDVGNPEGLSTYTSNLLQIVPHGVIEPMDMDHFGRGRDHQRVIESVADACIKADQAYVSS